MGIVRVSVANLATVLQSTKDGMPMYFGIPNPKQLEKGITLFQALGGGAELTEQGVSYLETTYGAKNFERDPQTGLFDARFLVDDMHLKGVFDFFSFIAGKASSYEMDPTRDILAEISGKEFPEMGTILTQEETAGLELVYLRTVRQKVSEDGVGTSTRAAAANVPSRRMFRIYKAVVTPPVYKKIATSNIVRFFLNAELATTDGGSRKGKALDGLPIADNLFLID